MPTRDDIIGPWSRAGAVRMLRATILSLLLTAGVAGAQTAPLLDTTPQAAPVPNPPPAAPPQPAPPQRDNPGLIQEIGKFFERGAANVLSPFDGTKKQIDEINQNAAQTGKNIGDAATQVGKSAADVVVKPLTSRIVSGHERCALAPNGAPDCVSAATALCKRNGYTTGTSMDFTSAEQCSPQVYVFGRQNAPTCATVTFISRALCQ